MTILDQIVSGNLIALEVRKRKYPLVKIKKSALTQSPPLDLAAALYGKEIKIIAEVKKASPSKGIIRSDFKPAEIGRIYASNGAAAISVLTEEKYFRGNLNHLQEIKDSLVGKRPPLLRKDFIYDPYQIYESRVYGADALLLIVAILTPGKLSKLLKLSHNLGMSCLVEVHNEAELDIALKSGAVIIGINNRDLTTFKVDLATTERLRPLIPKDRIVVSESGIKDRTNIQRLKEWGVNAVLIGETFMSAPDIAAKMKELM